MDDPTAQRISAAGDLLVKIASSNVVKVLLFLMGAVVVYNFYENRAEAMRILLGSPVLMAALGVSLLLSFIGWGFRVLIARVDDTQQARLHEKDNRISYLEGEARDERREILAILRKIDADLGDDK